MNVALNLQRYVKDIFRKKFTKKSLNQKQSCTDFFLLNVFLVMHLQFIRYNIPVLCDIPLDLYSLITFVLTQTLYGDFKNLYTNVSCCLYYNFFILSESPNKERALGKLNTIFLRYIRLD